MCQEGLPWMNVYYVVRKVQHGVRKVYHGVRKVYHGVKKVYHGVRKVYHGARKVYQGNRKVYHCARTQYQTIGDMSVLVVSPGFSLVREILSESVSEVNRWHQEHGLALWGKGHVKKSKNLHDATSFGCDECQFFLASRLTPGIYLIQFENF